MEDIGCGGNVFTHIFMQSVSKQAIHIITVITIIAPITAKTSAMIITIKNWSYMLDIPHVYFTPIPLQKGDRNVTEEVNA